MERFMANSLDSQYQQLLQDILEFGVDKQDRTTTGTKSIFGYTIHHNMSWGFPLLTTKKVPFKTMATELMWFLMGDTNIKYLVDNGCNIWNGDAYKNYLKKHKSEPFIFNDELELSKDQFIEKIKSDWAFAKEWGELGSIYGKQWRSWSRNATRDEKIVDPGVYIKQIDQIQNLINELKTNPDSRRLMVSAWNVGELDQMVLPPCHYGFQVYTRELNIEERLDWTKINHPNIVNENGWFDLYSNFEEAQLWFDRYDIGKIAPTRAISLMWNQRSVDVFLGLPFNIASYGLLLEMIAREVNMVPEHLIGHLGIQMCIA